MLTGGYADLDADGLARWERLFQVAAATPFQHPGFLAARARAYADEWHRVMGAIFLSDAEGDAAALQVYRVRLGPLRHLVAPGMVECDYAVPLLRPDLAGRVTPAALLAAFRAAAPPHDLMHLHKIAPPALIDAPSFAGLPGTGPDTVAFPLSLPGTPDQRFAGGMKGRDAARLRRRRRRLEACGTVRFRVYAGAGIAQAFAALQAMRAARFGKLGRRNRLADPRHAATYLEVAERHPEAAVLTGLELDGRTVALQYGFRDAGRYYMVQSGFEEGPLRVHALGRLLIEDTMRWCAEQGLSVYDFTVGGEPYKADFGAVRHEIEELWLPATPLGRVALAGVRLKARVWAAADRMGL